MSGKASTTAAAAKQIELTPREVEVLAAAWQSFKTDPEIDIAKLSRLVGFQNPRSAGNLMGTIKKKLMAMEANNNFSVAAVPKAKPAAVPKAKPAAAPRAAAPGTRRTAASKRKTAAVEDAGAEADNEASEAPTPAPQKRQATGRKRKALRSARTVEEEVHDEDDGDDDGDDEAASASAGGKAQVVKDEVDEEPMDEGNVKDEAHDPEDVMTMYTHMSDDEDEV